MSYDLQNFYKATVSLDWSIGTGNFYVSVKPTVSTGWVVVSPNNATLREIVKFTATGTDSNGDYITISVRGVGGTSEQTHSIGEPVNMNITAEYWDAMNTDIAAIVAAGAPDASTTSKGLVEEATQAEVNARSTTGGTGARLFVNPSTLPTAVTLMPQPNYPSYAAGTTTWNSNTTGYTSQFVLPVAITVNKISFNVDSTPVDGTIKIGVYSEDGQTKEIDVTSATLSALGLYTITLGAAVTLSSGVHYVVVVPVSTTSVTAYGYPVGTGADALNPVTSEPKLYGTQTVTAGTLPTTFTPSALTDSTTGLMPYIRFDN